MLHLALRFYRQAQENAFGMRPRVTKKRPLSISIFFINSSSKIVSQCELLHSKIISVEQFSCLINVKIIFSTHSSHKIHLYILKTTAFCIGRKSLVSQRYSQRYIVSIFAIRASVWDRSMIDVTAYKQDVWRSRAYRRRSLSCARYSTDFDLNDSAALFENKGRDHLCRLSL